MEFVFGLATALPVVSSTAISVVTGVAQGVSEQKRVNADASNQVRMLKFHVDTWVDEDKKKGVGPELTNGIVTLRDSKVWVEAKNEETKEPAHGGHHPFTGFYLAYPDDNRSYTRGLVSTISVDPPMLNWIYVDKDTYECKFAARSGSIMHHVGDYDWTSDDNDSCITFDGFEGFVVVEEKPGEWALYFDMDDDGLKSKKKGRKVVELHLQRRVITGQEVNKWGLKEDGNIGFKSTKEVDKISKPKPEGEQQRQSAIQPKKE
ncbi:hypothetical protein CBER1_04024 [Cercospora berteroae]|uniref:Uncharacterized protein n=1 Tax=Cercospora berteroae TaxID=357750 RepID=A0A2S6C4W5_9PEZI|nr:hypothetical protein CBER1_04024 [Cercospora berteroae]